MTPSFTDGTATKGTDYTENTAALSFAGTAGETQTVTVATAEDSDDETDETFTVSLSVSGATVTATDTATGTITNDAVAPAVTVADASAREGDSMTFTVTLDKAVSGGFTVTPGFTDGTATKGTDYTENTAALSFAGTAGETQTVTVATAEDSDDETDETFTVSLSVSGATVTATDTATGTITDDDAAPAVTVADASASEGDSMTFTVTLDKAVSGGLTVTPNFTDGTAAKGTDYTENTAALSFVGTAGETQTFTVATAEDTDNEHETFTVGLSISGTSATVTATDTATGTIIDGGGAAVLIDNAQAQEGNRITFAVVLSKAVAGGLTVTPSFTDGTATEGRDYTENTAAITFAGAEDEVQVFTVETAEDDTAEPDETFTVSLTVSGTSTKVTANTATGTILDDDSVPAVTIVDASADEGDQLAFTMTLNKPVWLGFKVTPSFTDGTTTKGADYKENTDAITFVGTRGEKQTFTVTTTEDGDVESDETFTVSLAVSGTSETVTAARAATGTILNDDSPSVTVADETAAEGDALTFTVTLDKAVSGGFTVTPSFTDVSATEGTDYTANTAALSFAGTAGETRSFTVSTTEDQVVEADETFRVGLAVSGTSAEVTATDTATGTITNDDEEQAPGGGTPKVTIADASTEEGESLTFTVTLDSAVDGGLTVTPSFTDVTATKGTDYTENTAALNFTGTTGEQQTFAVSTTDDTDEETDETFTVGLTVSGTSETVAAGDTATGTILDDDSEATNVPPVITTPEDRVYEQGEVITPFGITVSDFDGDSVTVTLTGLPSGLSYASGQVRGTVATDAEAEAYTVTISADDGVNAAVTGTFTIKIAAAKAQVTIADASAAEGDALIFTLTLDNVVQGGLTVTPSFTDVTAVEGADYTANTVGLTFTGIAGETQTLTVATAEDLVVEDDETFSVSLRVSDAPSGVTAGGPATGTITDDDGGTRGADATVTIAEASAMEGESMTFGVTLNRAVQGGLTVAPSFTDVTAAAGTDYTANAAALTFTGNAGETQSFTVATVEDLVVEEDETFTVSLSVSNAPSGVTVGGPATGTITDDDGGTRGADATVTVAEASAAEGDPLTFTVTLNRAVQGGLTVTPSFTDVTAAAGTDYTENTGELSFIGKAGETHSFTVATLEDFVVEEDETFTVSLRVSDAPLGTMAGGAATGTITDDDGGTSGVGATVTIAERSSAEATSADASAVEGELITFTVTLNRAVQGGLTVTPSFTDGTAVEGTDYTANTAALTFSGTAGETHTLTVATAEDLVVEEDETFTVSLTVSDAPSGATAGGAATGMITDDDGGTSGDAAGGDATVTIAEASVAEGDPLAFTVTLNRAVQGGLTVTPSFADGTATADIDYTANTTALMFAGTVGEAQTFTVATVEDLVVEEDETFTVSLGVSDAPSGATAGDPAIGTITDDDGGTSAADATVTIAQATSAEASAVEGESMTFTVTLNRAVQGGLTVTPSYTDGTAEAGNDYSANLARLVFAGNAGETQSFTVATFEDLVVEEDETFTVSLSVSNAPSGVTAGGAATGTITDDDGGTRGVDATVTIAEAVSAEASTVEGESMTFTVTLNRAVQGGLTVTPSFTDGTAMAGTDYTANVAALRFAGTAGETQTLTVATVEDLVVEEDETFTVSLGVSDAPLGATAGGPATGTITDDDGGRGGDSAGGNATVTITDAVAAEGGDLTFTVTLDRAVQGGLTVMPSYTDGTAAAGTDYTENTVALMFTGTAGETQSFSVVTVEDLVIEEDETFTVSLNVSDAPLGATAGGPATGLIADDDAAEAVRLKSIQEPILADISLSMADGVASALSARIEQLSSPCVARALQLPGLRVAQNPRVPTILGLSEPERELQPTLREALSGGSFVSRPFGCGQRRGVTFWGQADLRSLSGRHHNGAIGWDGELFGQFLGADLSLGTKAMAGISLARFDSEFDYVHELQEEKHQGTYETGITSVHPYAVWSVKAGLDLWASVGYGTGKVRFSQDRFDVQQADSRWQTATTGGTLRLDTREDLLPQGTTTLDLKTEVSASRLQVEDNAELLQSLDVDTHRLRLMLVGAYARALASGAQLTPSLEIGARRDGGVGQDGTGLEASAGLRYSEPSGRLSFEARVHTLMAHSQPKDEWGFSGSIRLMPRGDGRGLSFSLSPAYGADSRGPQQLWDQRSLRGPLANAGAGARLEADVGYGLSVRRGLLTLKSGFSRYDNGPPRFTVGGTFKAGELDLNLELHRLESRQANPDYGIRLQGSMRF